MKTTKTLKSIGAVLTGFILVFVLSFGTDEIFLKAGLMRIPFHDTNSVIIILIIIYRSIYNTIGAYVVAGLAPGAPMRHAMIVGYIGFVLSLLATVAIWEPSTAWYSVSITLLAIPCAWVGGKLKVGHKASKSISHLK